VDVVKTISQRELRNDNAEVMRGVEEGETYTVTRRGVPVARLVPLAEVSDLRCDRPPKRRPSYTSLARVQSRDSTEELLNDLRGGR
jgi:prevent-host-death family protein